MFKEISGATVKSVIEDMGIIKETPHRECKLGLTCPTRRVSWIYVPHRACKLESEPLRASEGVSVHVFNKSL